MPRPRTVDDAAIFAAAGKVMSRDGPAKLTLARIAKEAGLAAPTLVQRFGSKQGLLRAMSRTMRGSTQPYLDALRAAGHSPFHLVREFVLCFAGLAPSADALVNNTLAYLQIDLADPVMRRHLIAHQKEQVDALARLIEEAIAAGQLSRAASPRALAAVLPCLATGSLLAWALHRRGTARDCLAHDIDHVLNAFRPSR